MDETRIDTLTIEIGASSDKATREIDKLSSRLKNIKDKSVRVNIDSKSVGTANKRISVLSKTLSSLKRVAFYRLIRTALKALGDAFREGQENAYWYSKTIGEETKYISEAYDNLSSASFKMKNQLGAAWATLRTAITPVLLEIVSLITTAGNAITQFFAALSGKSSYLKAIDYAKDWAEETGKGSKSAKEWKNQLLGFDVINRLEEPSTGGGGASALTDYENMFEEAEVPKGLKKIADFIKNDLGLSELVVNVKDFLFNWGDLTEDEIAQKAFDGLKSIVLGGAGFAIAGVPGAIVGTLLGLSLEMPVVEAKFTDGGMSIDDMKSTLASALAVVGGAAIGFKLAGAGGAIMGALFGLIALGFLTDFKVGKGLANQKGILFALKAGLVAACATIGWKVGGPGGAAIGALVGLGISTTLDGFKASSGSVVNDTVKNALNKILPGGLMLLGFETGGFKGAVMGLTAGLVLSLILNKLGDPKSEITENDVIDTLINALPSVLGALAFINAKKMGATAGRFGGVSGALLGLSVGTILSVVIKGMNANGGILTEDIIADAIISALPYTLAFFGLKVYGVKGALIGFSIGVIFNLLVKAIDIEDTGGLANNVFSDYVTRNLNTNVNATGTITYNPLNAYPQIPGHAAGGFPEDGLFYANHNELVGKFSNGRTAVANNEQITEGISRAVYEAFTDALSQTGSDSERTGEKEIVIQIDGQTAARALYRPMQNEAKRHGTRLVSGGVFA